GPVVHHRAGPAGAVEPGVQVPQLLVADADRERTHPHHRLPRPGPVPGANDKVHSYRPRAGPGAATEVGMEFGWSEAEKAYRAELRSFIEQERPGWREDPQHRRVITAEEKAAVRDFTGKLAERGWLTPSWPVEYGGNGQT